MSFSSDRKDFYNESHISSITPTVQIRDLNNLRTQRLLNRLFQELDDQNTELDNLQKKFSALALKSNIDYNTWSTKEIHIPIDNTTEDSNEDLLQNTVKQKETENKYQDFDQERALLLTLLHREKKLSGHYESLLQSYEDLITATAVSARDKREETFGVYLDTPNDSRNGNTKPIKSIESIQLAKALKTRAASLKQNSEMLYKLRKYKEIEIDLVRNTIAQEAQNFASILEQTDD
jgi:hypothetical protein